MPYSGIPEKYTDKIDSCVQDVMTEQKVDKGRAIAICVDSIVPKKERGKSLVEKSFNFTFPAFLKTIESETEPKHKSYFLEGIASDGEVDLQGERMSDKALAKMTKLFKETKIPVYSNHGIEDWENSMGYSIDCQLDGRQVKPTLFLENPENNSKVKSLIKKLEHGTPISLSVGGLMNEDSSFFEHNDQLNKDILVIDDLKLKELSIVGIGAVESASISSMIAKSINFDSKLKVEKTENHKGKQNNKQMEEINLAEIAEIEKKFDEKFAELEKKFDSISEQKLKELISESLKTLVPEKKTIIQEQEAEKKIGATELKKEESVADRIEKSGIFK